MEWDQRGNWKLSKIHAPPKGYAMGGYSPLNAFGENNDGKNFNDAVIYFTYYFDE